MPSPARRRAKRAHRAAKWRYKLACRRRLTALGLATLTCDDAIGRLRDLEGQAQRARWVLGKAIRRFRRLDGHTKLGFSSLKDFAREWLGRDARTVSEWARVWERLAPYPQLLQAAWNGEVSWTALRLALPYLAPETERACLRALRGRTVASTKTLVATLGEVKTEDTDERMSV